jgi:glycosyltransferase involved in cell wall biosynthesis
MNGPKVAILLSTYNGAAHLEPLLTSILDQDWRDSHMMARDDGSTDGTLAILERWSPRIPLRVTCGANLGAKASFFELLYGAADFDIVAFADQDDVWDRDKLSRAVGALAAFPPQRPAMYCSRARVADQNLVTLGLTQAWPRSPCFANALVENIAMGCTTALNRAAWQLLTGAPPPAHALMHDWWCYLVVSAFGEVVFDPVPSMCYRQHGDNVVGFQVSRLKALADKFKRFLRVNSLDLLFEQAADFHARYAQRLPSERRGQLEEFLSFRRSQWQPNALTSAAFRRQHWVDDMFLRLRVTLPGLKRRATVPAA